MIKIIENKIEILHLQKNWKVTVLGSGIWATALVKILTENKKSISWYIRNKENALEIKNRGINSNYLESLKLKT